MNTSDGNPGTVNQYSAAVTTGQGQCDWKDTVTLGRVRGQRAAIPTCGIPPASFASTKIYASAPDWMVTSGHVSNLPTTRGSDSADSMQHSMKADQHPMKAENPLIKAEPEVSDVDSLSLSESGSDVELEQVTRGSRNRSALQDSKKKDKKKVGRPIAYKGDPNSPDLTEPERRRIKRRIANRESARRVRHKRQNMLEGLQCKIDQLNSQNSDLKLSALESNHQKEDLSRQLREITEKYKILMAKNENMHCELQSLRAGMQVRMSALEDALERQDVIHPEDFSAFGSTNAQSSQTPGFVTQPVAPSPAPLDFRGSFSFQLDFDYMSAMEDQKSLDLLNCTSHELAFFKNGSVPDPCTLEG